MDLLRGRQPMNWNAITKSHPHLSQPVLNHLFSVYTTLCSMLLLAGLGSYLYMAYGFGGTLTFIGCIALIFCLAFTPHVPQNQGLRLAMLLAFGLLEGATLGPFLSSVLSIEGGAEIILMALGGTSIVFGCFSAAAMFARRQSYLYLGGLLGSGLSLLFMISFVNLFLGSTVLYTFHLYLGLMVFCGFVIFDTQLIIEKVIQNGSSDYIWDSLQLFLDFVGIFIRLVILLTKNKKKNRR